jgi:hypothetical protein
MVYAIGSLLHALGRRNLILWFVESSRSPRVTHSFPYTGAEYKCLYGGTPYKSPKIAENRRKSPKIAPPAAAVGFGSARGGQISSKIAELPQKKKKKRRLRAADLQGSAGPPHEGHS